MRLRRSSALQTHYLTLSNVGIISDFYEDDYNYDFDDADFDYDDDYNDDFLCWWFGRFADKMPESLAGAESCFSPDRPWHQDALELHCDDDDHDVEI